VLRYEVNTSLCAERGATLCGNVESDARFLKRRSTSKLMEVDRGVEVR